jgi:Fe-S oxidoreductase
MVRALQVGSPGENLLRLIPGLAVQAEQHGCSGMAGTFGLARRNYRTSLRAGWDLISWMRQGTMQIGATECSTCKLQMEQGTTKPTIHPIKLLALAYGAMPQLQELLFAESGELVAT